MAAVVDLTLPLAEGMPYNPDHFPPSFERYATVGADGWEASRLVLDSHLGTHLDAPRHFVDGGASVHDLDLADLVGQYHVAHLAPVEPGTVLRAEQVLVPGARRVLLATGWSEAWLHDGRYFSDCPVLARSAAQALVEAGVRVVGIDGPTVDLDGDCHRTLLGAGCVIVEGLTNLTKLGDTADVAVLPLPIRDGDGSPVRAVALLG